MSDDQVTLLAIKGAISELPDEQRMACNELAESMRQMVLMAPPPVGTLAFALVGAELQMEGEE